MRRLLERGVYFTLTVTTSTKQMRRVVCSRSKIENRVCECNTNLICANAKPRHVVNSSISISGLGYARFPGTGNARKCPTVEEIEQDAIRKSLLTKQARNIE